MAVVILLVLFLFVDFAPTDANYYQTESFGYSQHQPAPQHQQTAPQHQPIFGNRDTAPSLPVLEGLKVIGGTPALRDEWPWMAALVKQTRSGSPVMICGGSVITSLFVLTAAHCTIFESPFSMVVHVGGLTVAEGYKYPILKIAVHRNYSYKTMENDISLIQLRKMITARNVIPVRIHAMRNFNYARRTVHVTGWGDTYEGSDGSSYLMKLRIKIVPLAVCNRYYRGSLTKNHLCAGTKGKDTCKGDSGGPMVMWDSVKKYWLLIGITSFGNGPCGHPGPGVYTRVVNYADWIRHVIGFSLYRQPSVATNFFI